MTSTTSTLTAVSSADTYPSIQLPGAAVAADQKDLSITAAQLLHNLNLLPTRAEMAAAAAKKIADTPDSVAVVEAGLTKGSKYWSAAIAAGSTALTGGAALAFWNDVIGAANQPAAILGLALVLAAGSLAISYILGSDVRGRAAAMTATIEVRGSVARTVIGESRQAFREPKAPAPALPAPFPLPVIDEVTLLRGQDTQGWRVIAGRHCTVGTEFLLVKGARSEWCAAGDVQFP